MTAHRTRVRDNGGTGWRRWTSECLNGCPTVPAQSFDHAEDLGGRHAAATACWCYDPGSMEWSPAAPCGPYCESGTES